MPLDVTGVVNELIESRSLEAIINNVQAQFGTRARPYLGATILPEIPQDLNFYEEAGIRYRSIIANDGTRYSPVQIKSGVLSGSFEVRLGNQDAGSHFTARDYDTFLRLIRTANRTTDGPAMQAIGGILRWVDTQLNIPLREKIEKQRWEAIVAAQVVREGDGGYRETVSLSNPSGHRVASGSWTTASYDPFDDIKAASKKLTDKGYTVTRIIASTAVVNQLLAHPKIQQRAGGFFTVALGGTITGMAGMLDLAQLNASMSRNGLPPIETYDLQYQTDTGSSYFLERDVMVFVAETGRDEEIWLGPDVAPVVLPNTLGYVGIGTPAGQSSPGRALKVQMFDNKPPRIEGEAWQTSFPVIAEPEAIYVITDIPTGTIS